MRDALTELSKMAPRNLIVRMPDKISDFVMATPVLTDLRRCFPKALLTAMCQTAHAGLLDQTPDIDQLLTFQPESGWIHHYYPPDIIDHLRLGHYDLGLLLTPSFSSAWWFWRGKIQNRIGYATHGRSLLLNYPIAYPKEHTALHPAQLYKELLIPLGIAPSSTPPSLFVAPERLEAAHNLLVQYGWDATNPLIGIQPTKHWPTEHFRLLTEKLLEATSASIVYFGDLNAEALVQSITHHLPGRVLNLAGKSSLSDWVALIASCNLLVSDKDDPLYIAEGVGTLPVSLFESAASTKTNHPPTDSSPVTTTHLSSMHTRSDKERSVQEVFSHILRMLKQEGDL